MSGSLVGFVQDDEGTQCPYCKVKDTCFSNWIWAFSLTPEEQECLVNRGFSRLGMCFIKPTKPTTNCCPEFGIRCSALDFKISKSQKKVLRKFISVLQSGSRGNQQGHPKTKELEDYMTDVDSSRRLKVTLVKINSEEFLDSLPTVYQLYKKYQYAVHHDTPGEVTEERFKWNFCDSPINVEYRGICGSYHQHYYLDDTLIAVGVIDILPTMLCSVYFFYDPTYRAISIGTFGALCEISFVRKLNKEYPSLKYYSLGSFVPSSSKIRYKAEYSPTYLQCPETFSWVLLDDILRKTVKAGNVRRLIPPTGGKIRSVTPDPNNIQIQYEGSSVTYKSYLKIRRNERQGSSGCFGIFLRKFPCSNAEINKDKKEIKEYCTLVGPTLAERLILFRGTI